MVLKKKKKKLHHYMYILIWVADPVTPESVIANQVFLFLYR